MQWVHLQLHIHIANVKFSPHNFVTFFQNCIHNSTRFFRYLPYFQKLITIKVSIPPNTPMQLHPHTPKVLNYPLKHFSNIVDLWSEFHIKDSYSCFSMVYFYPTPVFIDFFDTPPNTIHSVKLPCPFLFGPQTGNKKYHFVSNWKNFQI